MLGFFRNITIALLVGGYIAGTQATLLRLTDLPATAAGPHALAQDSGKAKPLQRPVWTQRRHLPLVSKLTLSLSETTRPLIPEILEKCSPCFEGATTPLSPTDYFSSRCNKAPPQA
jgi:hypothetical protein